jgi:HEAT repeat protein
MFKTVGSLSLATAMLVTVSPGAQAQKPQASPKEQEAKLIAVLKSDASRKMKADACRDLARIGTQDSVAPLAALLASEELSHMARYGLEPIPDPSVDVALRDALGTVKGRLLAGVIGSIGVRRDHKAVPALVKLLGDGDSDVANAAAKSLGRIGTLEAATALEKALPTTPESGRIAVCEGLFRCADTLRSQGEREQARAIYELLRNASIPEYVKKGATRAEDSLRPATR